MLPVIERCEDRRLWSGTVTLDPAVIMTGPTAPGFEAAPLTAPVTVNPMLTSQAAVTPTPTPAARTAEQRIISWYSIGFSNNAPAHRNVGWNLPSEGWIGFVRKYIQPQVKYGVKRIMIHNPFGALDGEPMQFTQFQQATNAKLTFLANESLFLKAWKPITAAGVEVIAYIGSPYSGDNLLGPVLAKGDQGAVDAMVAAALKPLRAAGMSVAFDAASTFSADSLPYRVASQLRSQGQKVYIEAIPLATYTHWQSYPVMAASWIWTHPDRPTWGFGTGYPETILIGEAPPADTSKAWNTRLAYYRNLLGADNSIAMLGTDVSQLITKKITLAKVVSG